MRGLLARRNAASSPLPLPLPVSLERSLNQNWKQHTMAQSQKSDSHALSSEVQKPASLVDVAEVQPLDLLASLEIIDPAAANWLREHPDWEPDAY